MIVFVRQTSTAILDERQHLIERRRDWVETERKPNHTAVCRFAEAELEHVCTLLNTKCFARGRRCADYTAPLKPNDAEKDVFDDPVPRRCRWVSFNRERFSVAFATDSPDTDTWWLFMYATRTPHQCTFLQLRRRRHVSHTDRARYFH